MSSQNPFEFPQPKHDLFGAHLQFLANPEDIKAEFGFIGGSMPAGSIAPIHSHADPEVILVLQGKVDVYRESGPDAGWKSCTKGDVIIIPGHIKHALRNVSGEPMWSVFATGSDLYNFFREAAVPLSDHPAPPTPEQLEKVVKITIAHGHWAGSPQDNAAIGLEMPRLS